jgi:alpha-ketoglutarate-dependent taurine dioxygenase
MNGTAKMTNTIASQIRRKLDAKGYVVADVGSRDNYLAVCAELGEVTQTRELFIKRPDQVEKFAGYSHLPDEVPFHTDYPLINVVGLFCERPDDYGGDNLLMDSRDILQELSFDEKDALKNVHVPLPRSSDTRPILTEHDGKPHIYWLPALTLAEPHKRDRMHASAVKQFDRVLGERRNANEYLSFKLIAGEAIWFDNFVMLHGRDRLDADSKRVQVRAFIEYREANKPKRR